MGRGSIKLMKENHDDYEVVPFPKMRRFALDAGRMGRRKHIIHSLVELDVTKARQYIREHRTKTGESLSFTAFIITCLAKAVEMNRYVQAYRNWRGHLVIFDKVNVNTMIEVESEGQKIPMPHIIRAANEKTFRDIHEEIRATQAGPSSSQELKFMQWFLLLPAFVRRLFYWVVTKIPHLLREYSSSVLVTAVGMFGKGVAWGIPMPNFTLTVTLGSIAEKPGVVDGRIEIREYLCMTLSFDHDIIDGAPAARFIQRLKELIESGYGLSD
jgi:pyruvate/2-oxoglutarate dehydrogenase complex dihydrolipoamide acyltransferase (E2) component